MWQSTLSVAGTVQGYPSWLGHAHQEVISDSLLHASMLLYLCAGPFPSAAPPATAFNPLAAAMAPPTITSISEAAGDHVTLHLSSGQQLVVRLSFAWERSLPQTALDVLQEVLPQDVYHALLSQSLVQPGEWVVLTVITFKSFDSIKVPVNTCKALCHYFQPRLC